MRPDRRSLLPIQHVNSQQGLALVMALMFLAVLTIMGSTAVTINSTDLLLGSAFQASQAAFHDANSGVNYVTTQVASLVIDDKLKLDGTTKTESYIFKKPSGFEFNITQHDTFKRIAETRKYLLQVTGHSRPNSPIKSDIEVVLQRRIALEYGLFAANRLDLPARGRIFSYDSRLIKTGNNPQISTGTVKIAANGAVTAQAGHLDLGIDGNVILGETPEGEAGHFAFREASPDVPLPPVKITTGEDQQINLVPGGALPTDPLDIDKMVDEAQRRLRHKNDNGRELEKRDNRITSSFQLKKGDYYLKEITLDSNEFLTLNAKGGDINLYVDSITIKGNAKFKVTTDGEAGNGNVNIFLGGPASIGSESASIQPGFAVTGPARTFRIFSNSSEPINFYNRKDGEFSGELKGLIYAPYATVTVRNASATGYGLLWGRSLDFSTNTRPYTFYTDTALQEAFLSREVELLSWKELRD